MDPSMESKARQLGPQTTLLLQAILKQSNKDRNFSDIDVNAKACDENQAPILHLAVEEGLFDVTAHLIKEGAKASDTDNKGNTVLHSLAKCQEKKMIGKVIQMWKKSQQGWMPVNGENESPLGNSLYNKNELLTERLLKRLKPPDFHNQTVVGIPIKKKFKQGLKLLIDWQKKHQASPSVLACSTNGNPFKEAIRAKDCEIMKLLIENQDLLRRKTDDEPFDWINDLAQSGKLDFLAILWEHLTEAKKKDYLNHVCQINEDREKKKTRRHKEYTLVEVLRHRDPPRRAEYLRDHLLLAIAMDLTEQAEFILDYAQSLLFPISNEGKQHLRTVLYAIYKENTYRIEKTHLKMTPLVMTLHKKMPHLTNKLIEAEQRHLMPHDNELSHEKARAYHASSISDPQSLRICLESGNPSRKIWKHYFDYLNKEEQLFARIGALNIEDKIIYLRLHRRWAVRDLNLSGLKLVTNALNHLDNEEQKQRIVCQPQQTEELLLFVANNNVDGNLSRLLEEFITQEFECHKSDQKQGYQCVLNQVDDISGSDYILDAFETHYPNSTSSKWKSLSKFAVITFYGLAVMGMNIWTDTVITKALDCASNRTNIPDGYGICNGNQDVRNSKAIPPTDPDDRDDRDTTDDRKWKGTNFQEAFNISSGSQLLHLTTTLTLWIWLLGQLIQPKSIFTYLGFGSAKQGAELEGIEIETGSAEIPLVERNRSRSGDSNASQMEKQVKSKQIISFCVLGFPVFAAAVMVFCILSGFWPELDWVWLGNTFSMSLIVVLAIAGLVIKCKMIFGQDNFLQDRDLFDSLDKQLTIAQIGESCMEATVQFILQTWLFARLQLADELHKKIEVLVSGKIFLSSMSLICSVSTIHFNLATLHRCRW